MAVKGWETKANVSREILAQSIKEEWLLPAYKMPSPERLDVMDIVKKSGILTAKELQITETDATGLVEKMAARVWTAVEVVIAFSKRATIGHQLVNHNH